MLLNIIGYAYGRAAQDPDCEQGPSCVEHSREFAPLAAHCDWLKTLKTPEKMQQLQALSTVAQLNTELANITYSLCLHQQRFLTLGGDHSCAIGTWSGAASALSGPLGLIWIDAHLDSHTPESSHSKNIHGMPLAVLLGFGEPALTNIQTTKPKISPENLVLIGIRSYEPEEYDLLNRLGVRIYGMPEIREKGLETVMEEALKKVSARTSAFGFSLDLDAIDPSEAPGVGSKAPEGLSALPLIKSLKTLIDHTKFIGAEIAEFNPIQDENHKTEHLIIELIRGLC